MLWTYFLSVLCAFLMILFKYVLHVPLVFKRLIKFTNFYSEFNMLNIYLLKYVLLATRELYVPLKWVVRTTFWWLEGDTLMVI